MSKWFKWSTVGSTTFATMDGYRRAVNNDKKVSQSDRLLQNTIEQYQDATKQISETERFLDSCNAYQVATYGRNKEKIEWIDREMKNLIKQASTENNNKTIETSTNSVNNSISDLIKEVKELTDKTDSTRPKSNYLNNFYDLFGSYSSTQLGAIAHIFLYIIIYLCLVDIITVYYSDYLIIYFKF